VRHAFTSLEFSSVLRKHHSRSSGPIAGSLGGFHGCSCLVTSLHCSQFVDLQPILHLLRNSVRKWHRPDTSVRRHDVISLEIDRTTEVSVCSRDWLHYVTMTRQMVDVVTTGVRWQHSTLRRPFQRFCQEKPIIFDRSSYEQSISLPAAWPFKPPNWTQLLNWVWI